MQFLGVGPLELLLILVVALVVVGPQRLPKMAADMARTIREIRRYTSRFASEFTAVVKDLENETLEERGQWKEIGEGLDDATQSIDTAVRDARADAEGANGHHRPAAGNGRSNGAPKELPPLAPGITKRTGDEETS
jgi:Tat protein translocase TatB subunit